ncbi:Rap1a/Tai family immunity protein [Hydrogenophaga sp. T2]|uniref:Rap1a/Tai family immunity protein n=1 Tax=Hydrogenophaga sp. T2 TaxID=3132823 RepID=UPI003CF6249D
MAQMTGNDAIQAFTGSESARQNLGIYVLAVMHSETAVRINSDAAKAAGADRYIRPMCIPRGASAVQGAAIVEKALLSYPERNHEDFYVITRRALVSAWPCASE